MRGALLAVLLAAGCRSEGGVEFSYALYRDGNPPTPAATCSAISVSRIRFMVGQDANADQILDDDELEGRATLDCNQSDRDNNQVLTTTELGHFETADDRLPAGDYNMFAIELALLRDNTISTIPSRTFIMNGYYERWTFVGPSGGTLLTIEELAVTHIDFSAFDSGSPELRLIAR